MNASQRLAPVSLGVTSVFRRARLWGGLAFAFGNLLFLVNKLDEMSLRFLARPMPDVISGQHLGRILLGQVALVIGYIAYYKFYAPRTGRFGRYALRLFTGGGMLLALGHLVFMSGLEPYIPAAVLPYAEGIFILVAFGLLFLLIGLISFGILNLRRPVLQHWRRLPLATGLMGFIGFFLTSGEEINATFLVFRTLFALGLMGHGLTLWLEQRTQQDAVAFA